MNKQEIEKYKPFIIIGIIAIIIYVLIPIIQGLRNAADAVGGVLSAPKKTIDKLNKSTDEGVKGLVYDIVYKYVTNNTYTGTTKDKEMLKQLKGMTGLTLSQRIFLENKWKENKTVSIGAKLGAASAIAGLYSELLKKISSFKL